MRASQVIAVELLKTALPDVRVSTRKPDPTPEKFVVVSRIGGGSEDWATRDPRFLIECFATDEVEAEVLAQTAWEAWRTVRTSEIYFGNPDANLVRYDDPDPKLNRFQFTGGLKLKVTS